MKRDGFGKGTENYHAYKMVDSGIIEKKSNQTVADFCAGCTDSTDAFFIEKALCDELTNKLLAITEDVIKSKAPLYSQLTPEYKKWALMEFFYGRGANYNDYNNLNTALSYANGTWKGNRDLWDKWWNNVTINDDKPYAQVWRKGNDCTFETFVKATTDFGYPWEIDGKTQGKSVFDRKYSLFYKNGQGFNGTCVRNSGNEEEIFSNRKDSEIQTEICSIAKKQLGEPYVMGKKQPPGFDCSGLVYYSHKLAGVECPYGTDGYKAYKSKELVYCPHGLDDGALSILQVGDVVHRYKEDYAGSKYGHCGIYIGNGEFIHASGDKKHHCVVIMNLKDYLGKTSKPFTRIYRFWN